VELREPEPASLNAGARAEAGGRTLYRFDVRTPEEYAASHPSGFISAPGGQLVQATDEWVAVRGARIVLFDDDGVRARMTASWLVQMGWEAIVVEDGALEADEVGGPAARRPRPPLPVDGAGAVEGAAAWTFITPAQLAATGVGAERVEAAAAVAVTVVDLAQSPVYANAHIPGARFLLRSRFAEDLARLPGRGPLVLTSPDGDLARDAAAGAVAATGGERPVFVLEGGTAAWIAAGLPLERERHHWISPAIDVYKRPYEGTDNAREAMQAYIDWELQLVAQLANDGVSNFHVVRAGVS
jgi:rhodanese-related sulfurtransferase